MRPYNRNVYLAVFLFFLGGLLLIIGVSLYLRGNPEDSGEEEHDLADSPRTYWRARNHTAVIGATTAHLEARWSAQIVLCTIQG